MTGFTPVDVRSLNTDTPPLMDLYQLVQGQYVLYCEAEASFSASAKMSLLENGVAVLYVPTTDRSGLSHRNLTRLLSLPDSQMPPLLKAGMLYSTAIAAAKGILTHPESPDGQRAVEQVVRMTISQLTRSRSIFFALLSMMQHDSSMYSHAVNVCTYAAGLGVRLRWEREDLRALGFAAFLHDVGKTRVPVEILRKTNGLTDEEAAILRRHPDWGAELLRESAADRRVEEVIVRQHHERLDRSGYPAGLGVDAVHPAARLLAVADVYDRLTSHRPDQSPRRPYDALATMRDEMGAQLDQTMLCSFIQLLGGR